MESLLYTDNQDEYLSIFTSQLRKDYIRLLSQEEILIKSRRDNETDSFFPSFDVILTVDNNKTAYMRQVKLSFDSLFTVNKANSLLKTMNLQGKSTISSIQRLIGVCIMENNTILSVIYEEIDEFISINQYIKSNYKDFYIIPKDNHSKVTNEVHPRRKILSLIKKIIVSINEIHNEDLFHGDINPFNIVIHKQNLQIKLINFKFKDLSSDLVPTVTSVKFNQSLYQSPDLFKFTDTNTSEISWILDNQLNDIWSLGVVLSEILSDERPWSNVNCKNFIKLEYLLSVGHGFRLPCLLSNEKYKEIYDILSLCTCISKENRLLSKDLVRRFDSVELWYD